MYYVNKRFISILFGIWEGRGRMIVNILFMVLYCFPKFIVFLKYTDIKFFREILWNI